LQHQKKLIATRRKQQKAYGDGFEVHAAPALALHLEARRKEEGTPELAGTLVTAASLRSRGGGAQIQRKRRGRAQIQRRTGKRYSEASSFIDTESNKKKSRASFNIRTL
jgi:hypothetical protein